MCASINLYKCMKNMAESGRKPARSERRDVENMSEVDDVQNVDKSCINSNPKSSLFQMPMLFTFGVFLFWLRGKYCGSFKCSL